MNILGNYIGEEHACSLIGILDTSGKLTTLCRFTGNEAELDLSKKGLSAGCAVLVANEMKVNRALTFLDVSGNVDKYSGDGPKFAKHFAESIKGHP